MMNKLLKNEQGNMLVLSAIGLTFVIGFAAWAIDVGYVLTANTQLQNAADAAALAGASGLIYSTNEATDRAIVFAGRNDCINTPVQISPANVTFPTATRIQVRVTRDLPTFFMQAFGIPQLSITRQASADAGTLQGTSGMRPWGVPKFNWQVGEAVVIKSGAVGAVGTEPSYFYPIDFPPINRGTPETGASVYEDNIRYGTAHWVYIGDVLQVEPGNKTGPTSQGITDLLGLDPNAFWAGDHVESSLFVGMSSPRVVKIPLYDPAYPPDSGRNEITCIGLAAFFIEGMQGKNVIGRFVKMITHGSYGSGGYSILYGVHLAQ